MALKILVIDDVEQNRATAIDAIRKALGEEGEVQEFPVTPPVEEKPRMHAERLADDLGGTEDVSLIVADRDLSGYKEYVGLSESIVQQVADASGIPECGYARGHGDSQDEFVLEGRYREACIRIARVDDEKFARQVLSIANGFSEIASALSAQEKLAGKLAVPKTLAAILGKPHLADKFALYASGDHSRLTSLIRPKGENDAAQVRRLSCFLGYWLWDSILRFPGIVVDDVAASSHLNIALDDFRNQEVQGLFEDQLYKGPFADAKPRLWWRSMLDDLVGQSGEPSGREFAMKKLGRNVLQSRCCENADIPAGYYCFLKQRPVSYENSKPGLAWFPRGADLTRISNSEYAEKVPWL